MSGLNVGDVCEIIGYIKRADLLGRECTIVGGLGEYACVDFNGIVSMKMGFRVQIHGEFSRNPFSNGLVVCLPHHLRKKQPPQELTTWEAVQSITGWKPAGVPA